LGWKILPKLVFAFSLGKGGLEEGRGMEVRKGVLDWSFLFFF